MLYGWCDRNIHDQIKPTRPHLISVQKEELQYDGTRYLKHSGNGEIFLKGGADSPENFLAYREFDGTYYGGSNKARSGEAAPNQRTASL